MGEFVSVRRPVKQSTGGAIMKPRVMLVGPWKSTRGGVTTFMSNLAGSPLSRSYEFLRFDTARPPKRNVSDNYGYGAMLRGGVLRFLTGAAATLYHLLIFPLVVLVRRPALVQVQSSDFQAFWESALYVLACKTLRIPVLMRLGGAFDNFYSLSSPLARTLIRRALQLPDRLIVQSAYWRGVVASMGRSEGVVELANWVPDSLFAPLSRPERTKSICLFGAGADAVRKGMDDVLEAIRLLHARNAPVRFRIVAAAPSVCDRIGAENLGDMVQTEGPLPHERMLDAMRQSDIFVLPSRGEGFPNALLEAMASGAAPIVTPVGSIAEIVGEGAGVVVPVRDAAALADAIARLCADREWRETIARGAQARVRTRYTESAVLPVLEKAWMSLLRRPERRASA